MAYDESIREVPAPVHSKPVQKTQQLPPLRPAPKPPAESPTTITQESIDYFAKRPLPEFDRVVVKADYAARAALSFYRFRTLGGGQRDEKADKATPLANKNGSKFGAHYASDHPKVRIHQLSIIALLVVFESAANAYFFAQQSEFGLAGGVFQAAAVSLANVAVAFFIIGFWGLRHITQPAPFKKYPWNWDRRQYIKLFGALAIVTGILLVLLVNLSAAHYRNILDMQAILIDKSPEEIDAVYGALASTTSTFPRFWIDADVCQAVLGSDVGRDIGSAATSAMCRPMALHSLDAMVLFALGIAISALAAFEGRRSDSPFPGLSDNTRHFERAREELEEALEDYYDTEEETVELAREFAKHHKVSFPQKKDIQLRKSIRSRVARYAILLDTHPDMLAVEFDVPQRAVELVTDHKSEYPA